MKWAFEPVARASLPVFIVLPVFGCLAPTMSQPQILKFSAAHFGAEVRKAVPPNQEHEPSQPQQDDRSLPFADVVLPEPVVVASPSPSRECGLLARHCLVPESPPPEQKRRKPRSKGKMFRDKLNKRFAASKRQLRGQRNRLANRQ